MNMKSSRCGSDLQIPQISIWMNDRESLKIHGGFNSQHLKDLLQTSCCRIPQHTFKGLVSLGLDVSELVVGRWPMYMVCVDEMRRNMCMCVWRREWVCERERYRVSHGEWCLIPNPGLWLSLVQMAANGVWACERIPHYSHLSFFSFPWMIGIRLFICSFFFSHLASLLLFSGWIGMFPWDSGGAHFSRMYYNIESKVNMPRPPQHTHTHSSSYKHTDTWTHFLNNQNALFNSWHDNGVSQFVIKLDV